MSTSSSPKRRFGLSLKLTLLILLFSGTIFTAAFGYSYLQSRSMALKASESIAKNLASATLYRLEAMLSGVAQPPKYLASLLEREDVGRRELLNLIRSMVQRTPEIFGSAAAFEPDAFEVGRTYFSPYFFREGKGIGFAQLGSEAYNYFLHDWYLIPKVLDKPLWSEPYFDEGGGNIIMATYSQPFYDEPGEDRTFRGILSADVSLEWLRDEIAKVHIYESGYAFLISANGVFVSHPESRLIMRKSIFTLAEETNDIELRRIGRSMIHGGSEFVRVNNKYLGENCRLFFAPLPSTGWSMGLVVPEHELFADLNVLSRETVVIGVAGMLMLLVAVVLISRSITRPIGRLAKSAKILADGDLDLTLPVARSRDEVGDLTDAFSHMRDSLKEYIENLTATTAAKERIESELKIAHDIQMGILPRIFPPFPERDEFDLHATIDPAREVGGDLYDFFFIDDDNFCFIIGDVSDKGVPAAFFMAVTKTLLKATAEKNLSPGEILTKVNEDLSADNESCMFVTLMLCIMNIHTGEVRYGCAGHNPPVIMPAHDAPIYLETQREPVCGAMEGVEYTTKTLSLEPGDTLFLYTDGVTEAMNANQDIYSEERLALTLSGLSGQNPKALVDEVMRDIRVFTGGASQSDDITILAVRLCDRA